MAGSKRERQLNRAKIARQQRAEAEAAERRKRMRVLAGITVAILLVAIIGGVAAVNAGSDDSNDAAPAPTAVPSATPTPSATKATKAAKVTCTKPNDKQPNGKQYSSVPSIKLISGEYKETLTTNCGTIEFSMDSVNAPKTTKSVSFLSDRDGFYNNTTCHRLTTEGIYVLQCGDPKGDGTGGPGYQIKEENLPKASADGTAVYPRGTVAMANAGPGTTGSQFFLVYKDSPLPPDYTVLGEITEGLDILDYVASKGVEGGGTDGTPAQPVQIQKMVSSLTYGVDQ